MSQTLPSSFYAHYLHQDREGITVWYHPPASYKIVILCHTWSVMCFSNACSLAVSLDVDYACCALSSDNAQPHFQLEAVKSFNNVGILPFNLFAWPNRRRLFCVLNNDIKIEYLHNSKVKTWKCLESDCTTNVLCLFILQHTAFRTVVRSSTCWRTYPMPLSSRSPVARWRWSTMTFFQSSTLKWEISYLRQRVNWRHFCS